MPIYYTVYKITNKINGKIYIGLHKTDDLNDGYMGSGKSLRIHQKKFGLENFEKEILFVFNNPEEMIAKEEELVNEEFVARTDTYNRMKGGVGGWGATVGTVTVRDKEGNCFRVPMNDQRYLSGELISVVKNKVSVKDKEGNNFQVFVNDPRYISGELKFNCAGRQRKKSTTDKINLLVSLDSEIILIRNRDYSEIKKTRGYISELSRKWGISHTAVRNFIEKYCK